MHQRRLLVLGIGIFVLVVVSLQIFLLMVGLEAWLTYDSRVAWGAAITSAVLAAFVVVLHRSLTRGPRTIHTTTRMPRTAPAATRSTSPTADLDPSTHTGSRAARSSTTNRHTV
jgi:hypothetical protein